MSNPKSEIQNPKSPAPWWYEFFTDEYAAYGLAADDPAEDAQRIDFLIAALGLKPGDTVFDQCCGVGRLSIPLAERGLNVVGVDRVPSYIERAQREAASRGLASRCSFHCADAAEFVSTRPCDASVNWFTSFGYSEDDEQTLRIFQRAYDSLNARGRAIFEYQNIPRIMADFQHGVISRSKTDGGLLVLQENTPDFIRGMMNGRWTFIQADGRRIERDIQTRLFMPHEIVRLLARCGFHDFELLGGRDGSKFSRTSSRLVVICRK